MAGSAVHMVESLFKKRFWIVTLVVIFAVAMLFAAGFNGLVAKALAPYTVALPSAPPEVDTSATAGLDDGMAISELLRAPATEDEPAEEEPEEEVEEPEEVAEPAFEPEGVCVQSNLPVMLVGTMVDGRGDWSLALVSDQSANRTYIIGPGDMVAGAEVLRVEREHMWVEFEGQEHCMRAGREPATSAPATTTASRTPTRTSTRNSRSSEEDSSTRIAQAETPSRPTSSETNTDSLQSGIERVDPSTYRIQRNTIQEAVDNPRLLQAQAPEFQQAFEDGRPAGIQITSMPAGSIFGEIGIRRGDILVEVNGNRITTPQRSMELYEALQSESRVELVVMRRGRRRALTYDIR